MKESDIQRGGDRQSKQGKAKSKATTLVDMGVTKDQSSKWQKIANIPEEKFENYLAVEKELTTAGILRKAPAIIIHLMCKLGLMVKLMFKAMFKCLIDGIITHTKCQN